MTQQITEIDRPCSTSDCQCQIQIYAGEDFTPDYCYIRSYGDPPPQGCGHYHKGPVRKQEPLPYDEEGL